MWVDKRYENFEYLQVTGAYSANYLKAACIEDAVRTQQLLEDYSSFMLLKRYNTSGDKYIFPEGKDFSNLISSFNDKSLAVEFLRHIYSEKNIQT